MENKSLSFEDLKILKRLVVISRSILNNYYCLMDLESNGNTFSEEYNNIVNELLTNFEMEDELYSSIKDINKVGDYLFYLNGYEQNIFENYLFLIFDYTPDKLIQSRIVSRLEYMMDTKEFDHDIDEDIDEEEEIKEEKFLALNRIQISIEDDIIKTMINFINEYIKDLNYRGIRYTLIEYKYMLIYLFNDIEKEMINNKYHDNNMLNWGHQLLADFYHMPDKTLEEQKEEYSLDLLTEGRELLTMLLDAKIEKIDDILDSDYFVDATVFSIIIRTCLLFTNKESRDSFINILETDLEDIKSKNESVIPFIRNIIDGYKNDIEIPSVLRLKK